MALITVIALLSWKDCSSFLPRFGALADVPRRDAARAAVIALHPAERALAARPGEQQLQ
jgi:hypothetical protein